MTNISFSAKPRRMSDRKARIAGAFDRAEAYDAHARVQRIAAERLAGRIAALDIDVDRPALEIGCGTGFLTRALLDARPGLSLTATDISSAMILRARHALGQRPGLTFATLDGEDSGSAPQGGWGLIASSLAVQWFEHPLESILALAARLAPGGKLAFATLAEGSFAEWRAALGVDGIVRNWLPADAWASACPAEFRIETSIYDHVEAHAGGLAFLRALKSIGAATSWDRTLSPAHLRRALAAFEAGGARITYRIANVVIEAPEGL